MSGGVATAYQGNTEHEDWFSIVRERFDPTFLDYLDEVLATRYLPISQDIPVDRRKRIADLRRKSARPVPQGLSVENVTARTRHGDILLRITRPIGVTATPCILYYHGGGWVYGSPEQSAEDAYFYASRTGAAVIAPYYRLAPEHPFPAAFLDAQASLIWAYDNARELDIDRNRIVVLGDSAGGNLAAAVALAERDKRGVPLRLQVLNYPALGLDFQTSSYLRNADAPILSRDEMVYFWQSYLGQMPESHRNPYAIPLSAKNFDGLPPAHIVAGYFDPLHDDGAAYARQLEAAGVRVTFEVAHRLPHGFLRATASKDVQTIALGIVRAIKESLSNDGVHGTPEAAARVPVRAVSAPIL